MSDIPNLMVVQAEAIENIGIYGASPKLLRDGANKIQSLEIKNNQLQADLEQRETENERLRTALDIQPMETAPRDGTEVILKVEHRAGIPNCYLVGHYMGGGHCIEDHPPIDSGWYFWNGCMFDKASKPIGWIALPPEPPKEESQ